MKNGLSAALLILLMMAVVPAAAAPTVQVLQGTIGVDEHHGSGYLDLKKATTFHPGDRLRISVGGSAAMVVVRLLPEGSDPNDPNIIVRPSQIVPPGRVFDVVLGQDYPNIGQVSVHGNPKPWNLFPLGAGNGPALLLSVELLR
jgi:hypothetical protein